MFRKLEQMPIQLKRSSVQFFWRAFFKMAFAKLASDLITLPEIRSRTVMTSCVSKAADAAEQQEALHHPLYPHQYHQKE